MFKSFQPKIGEKKYGPFTPSSGLTRAGHSVTQPGTGGTSVSKALPVRNMHYIITTLPTMKSNDTNYDVWD